MAKRSSVTKLKQEKGSMNALAGEAGNKPETEKTGGKTEAAGKGSPEVMDEGNCQADSKTYMARYNVCLRAEPRIESALEVIIKAGTKLMCDGEMVKYCGAEWLHVSASASGREYSGYCQAVSLIKV